MAPFTFVQVVYIMESMVVKQVFFAGTSTTLSASGRNYSKIVSVLHNLDIECVGSWVVRLMNGEEPAPVNGLTVLEQQQQLLRGVDLMVVECSSPSFGIGYLMHQAVSQRTPLLCLYDDHLKVGELSDMITGNHSTLIKVLPYSLDTVNEVIAGYLSTLKGEDIHKFNFLATSEILEYIEEGAEKNGTSKSEFLRDEIVSKIIRKPYNL